MDIARAFTYITEDENWQNKAVVTIILGLIPIVNLAVVGWMLDLIRNMLDGYEKPMPDWNDLGGQIGDRLMAGLMTAIAGFFYMLPLIAFSICFGIVMAALDSSFVGLLFSLIAIAYAAVAWLPLSIGMIRYSRTRNFSAYTDFARNIALAREHLSTLVVLAVFVFVVGIILGIVTSIPCIGWIIGLASVGINAIIVGHLVGQAALLITRAGGAEA